MEFLVRAHVLGDMLAAANAYDRGPIAVDVAAAVARVSPATWVRGQLYVELFEQALHELGADRVYDLSRRSVTRTAEGPFMSSFAAMARRMSGNRPGPFLRWFPGSRAMMVRGGGDATFILGGSNSGRVDIVNPPPPLAESNAWRIGIAGVLQGIIELAGQAGSVRSTSDRGAARFELLWWPARASEETSAPMTAVTERDRA